MQVQQQTEPEYPRAGTQTAARKGKWRWSIVVLLTLCVLGAELSIDTARAEAQSFCAPAVGQGKTAHVSSIVRAASQPGCYAGTKGHTRKPVFPHRINKPVNRNVFPYGACTWWADQRYYQLHGIFVPWRTQANAWQWVARARQFGWHVSRWPSPGAIVVLQPWVEGAYGLGHVAVVERILRNGHVIASNMSWGRYPWRVAYAQFAPGPGVMFISQ